MELKEKASVQPLAQSKTEFLQTDLNEADYYSQSLKYPIFVIPQKQLLLFRLPLWYHLREELGSNEAEILRDLDYWIRINFRKRRSPSVYWIYEKLSERIRI